MSCIELSKRQTDILEIISNNQPITSELIAEKIGITRSALRTDLSILTKLGFLEAKPKVGYVSNLSKIPRSTGYLKKRIGDVMSIAVIINEKESLHSAIIQIFMEDVGSIFIVGEKGLSGIVSRKDLVKAMIGGTDLNTVPVSMIMTRMPNVITIQENSTIQEGVNKLIEHEIDSLPVVRLEGSEMKVVGRFTKTNATKLFAEIISTNEARFK